MWIFSLTLKNRSSRVNSISFQKQSHRCKVDKITYDNTELTGNSDNFKVSHKDTDKNNSTLFLNIRIAFDFHANRDLRVQINM